LEEAMDKSDWNDQRLVEEFVACFGRWDALTVGFDLGNVTSELATGEEDEYGDKVWQPLRIDTPPAALEALYTVLPARLPQLYERLILSYRWATVDLDRYELLANPPGPGLTRLLQTVSHDPGLWEVLLPAGFIPFGRGSGIYDPACFDVRRGLDNRDCPVVQLDHEWALCDNRAVVVKELAPTFRELVWQTIERTRGTDSSRRR
jgi:hypothetical protein